MKHHLPDGRTLCGLPDRLHHSLCQAVLRQGYSCPDHLGYAHGPFMFDPTTAYQFVYHIRGDIYCRESQLSVAHQLITKQHTLETNAN